MGQNCWRPARYDATVQLNGLPCTSAEAWVESGVGSPSVVTATVDAEVSSYDGVDGAASSLRDNQGRMLLLAKVRLDGRVDVAEVRDAIEIRVIPITRHALDPPISSPGSRSPSTPLRPRDPLTPRGPFTVGGRGGWLVEVVRAEHLLQAGGPGLRTARLLRGACSGNAPAKSPIMTNGLVTRLAVSF